MTMHHGTRRVRVTRVWWVAVAAFGFGAGPQEPWEVVRGTLPPVASAPPRPMPLLMPARADRGVMPAANQSPAAPSAMPARPVPLQPPTAPSFGANARVYIVDGVDPFGLGGLSQMAERLRESGYPDTRLAAWYEILRVDREIREAHRRDPNAPIIIIGYSYGVYRVKSLVGRLTRDGIPIAMVGYVGGDYLQNSPSNQMGAGRVVNVMGDGYMFTGRNLFFNGTDLDGANNVRLSGVRHFDLPKQEQTLGALVNGMNAATGRATWTSSPGLANGAGVPAKLATGPETIRQQPYTSASSPITTNIRR